MRYSLKPVSVACAIAAIAIAVVAVAHSAARAASGEGERVIKITARRFAYTPNEIVLKKGEPVTLAFTSIDFVHGFKVPGLGLRSDLPPGPPVLVHIVPEKAGRFPFLCDNFCGSKHEEMNGVIVVTD